MYCISDFFDHQKSVFPQKTDTIKIPITRALRWCRLFSIPMSGFPGSGIYTYLSKARNENLFPKKIIFDDKNSYFFFRKN